MKKFLKNIILNNIVKILIVYQKNLESKEFVFNSYIDQTIYFEIDYLVKLIKEKKREDEKNGI